jgi:hypothetical protein
VAWSNSASTHSHGSRESKGSTKISFKVGSKRERSDLGRNDRTLDEKSEVYASGHSEASADVQKDITKSSACLVLGCESNFFVDVEWNVFCRMVLEFADGYAYAKSQKERS